MPYKNKDKQRAYQRRRYHERRKEYFKDKPCVDCGATVDLEIDHIDPRLKVSHVIWSWSASRREAELAKCVVRCHNCHVKKTTLCKEGRSDPTIARPASYPKVICVQCGRTVGSNRLYSHKCKPL